MKLLMSLDPKHVLYFIGVVFLVNVGLFVHKGVNAYNNRRFWALVDLFWISGTSISLVAAMLSVPDFLTNSKESSIRIQNKSWISDIHLDAYRLQKKYCFSVGAEQKKITTLNFNCSLAQDIAASINNPSFDFIMADNLGKEISERCRNRKCEADFRQFATTMDNFSVFNKENRELLVFENSGVSQITKFYLSLVAILFISLVLPPRIGRSVADIIREKQLGKS